MTMENKCPTCGRFTGYGSDGYWDVAPGDTRGWDPIVAYCDENCCARKNPPAKEDPSEPLACVTVVQP